MIVSLAENRDSIDEVLTAKGGDMVNIRPLDLALSLGWVWADSPTQRRAARHAWAQHARIPARAERPARTSARPAR